MFIEYESNSSAAQAEALLDALAIPVDQVEIGTRKNKDFASIISDFQGVEVQEISQMVADSSVKRALFVTGQVEDYKNTYIDSLAVDLNPDDFSQLRITVYEKHSSNMQAENVVYRLRQGNRQLSSLVKNVSDNDALVFSIPSDLSGDFSISIEGDGVYYDNDFVFVIPERSKPVVTIIDEVDNLFLDQVLANAELFTVQKMKPDALDFSALRDSDVVLLNGVSAISSGLASQLVDKMVVLFPSSNISEDLGLEWMSISLAVADDTASYEMTLDAANPMFQGILSERRDFSALPVAKPAFEIGGDYQTLIPLRDGTPLLIKAVESEYYFFNAPLNLDFTNLPTHALFLPILYKLVLSSVDYDLKYYYYPGSLGFLQAEFNESPPKISTTDIEIIPEFSPQNDGIAFSIPEVPAGFYWLHHNEDTFRIAVNIPKTESVMEGLTVRELEENFGHLDHVSIQSAEAQVAVEGQNGNDLWKYALILVVFFLIIETLFHRYLK